MFREKLLFGSAFLSIIIGTTSVFAQPVGVPEQPEVTQVSQEATIGADTSLKSDEQASTSEDAVATITAEGDFLVPTYLLPVEETTTEKTDAASSSNAAFDELLSEAGIVLEEAPQNTPSNSPTAYELGRGKLATTGTSSSDNLEEEEGKTKIAQKEKPLLLPLAPVKELKKDSEGVVATPDRHVIPSDYADKVLNVLSKHDDASFIMPQEIKVTFYPNASDFSGQTLKWIKAFSLAAIADPRLVVDVRVSQTEPEIQEKRLILVKNALTGNGLSPHQIQVTYANRPKDTLILRNILKPETEETLFHKNKNGKILSRKTKKW